MKIAIFGANSQIATDLIKSIINEGRHKLYLYSRRPLELQKKISPHEILIVEHAGDYESFDFDEKFDALINFVGIGNPAAAAQMGADIFDVTLKFDQLALNYIRLHPKCKYIFLSSGAAYGGSFNTPADQGSHACIPINVLAPQDWYGIAKLYSECRHRAYYDLPIVDIRIFNYFSASQNIDAKFLICDILRSIRDGTILKTSSLNIFRDYIHPLDFHKLIEAVLSSPASNDVIDCYSRSPVDKFTLLSEMKHQFGLNFEMIKDNLEINATGIKMHYYSLSTRASKYGYEPDFSSFDCIISESKIILSRVKLT